MRGVRGIAKGVAALGALSLLVALAFACGGGGGGSTSVRRFLPFPPGLFPQTLASDEGPGDVAFRNRRELLIVNGSTEIFSLDDDGTLSVFDDVDDPDVGGADPVLRAVVAGSNGVVFAADDQGRIFRVDSKGVSSEILDLGSAVSGLAIAPRGFGDFGGRLIAAGAGGISAIDTGEAPSADLLVGAPYTDLVFFNASLIAINSASAELETVSAGGIVSFFADDLDQPVGLAVDTRASQLLVADAGSGTLRFLDLDPGLPDPPVSELAPYPFSATAPSGIAYDGLGAIAFVTLGFTDPGNPAVPAFTVRGSTVPPIAPPLFGIDVLGSAAGYGDLEIDRQGDFIGVATGDVDPANFVFELTRSTSRLRNLARDLGAADEELLSLAIDVLTETLYVGSDLGNLFSIDDGGSVALLRNVSADELLGLELAPEGFGAFGGQLVATTRGGEVFRVLPDGSAQFAIDTSAIVPPPNVLSDLVFGSDGTLYLLDAGDAAMPGVRDARILMIENDGVTASDLGVDADDLGFPDGLSIDEGGERLLVASGEDAGDDLLLAVDLVTLAVEALVVIDIDNGFFPSGVVYDQLGRVVLRASAATSRIDAAVIFPTP